MLKSGFEVSKPPHVLKGQSPTQQVWGMRSLEGLDHELVLTVAWGGVRVRLVEIVGGGTLLDE